MSAVRIECAYDELATEFIERPSPAAMALFEEAYLRLVVYALVPRWNDVAELAMALACGDES